MSHFEHCTFRLLGVKRNRFPSDISKENFDFFVKTWKSEMIQIDLVDEEGRGHQIVNKSFKNYNSRNICPRTFYLAPNEK